MNSIDAQKALERSYVSSIENTEYDEALKLAEMLYLLDPSNPEYSHKIAYVYLKELKWEEAIEAELKNIRIRCSIYSGFRFVSTCLWRNR